MTFGEDDMALARHLLARASGHAVVDQNGRRVGSVIGIVRDPDTDVEQLAIRDEGTFFWRRRLLPLQAVARVIAKKRHVVLAVDRKALRLEHAVPPGPGGDEEPPAAEEQSVLDRIGSYVDRADDADAYAEPPAADSGDDPSADRVAAPASAETDPQPTARHLLFVSSSRGYVLVEREGTPPTVGTRVDEPDLGGFLVVLKVGSSPLPNDDRACGFVERVS